MNNYFLFFLMIVSLNIVYAQVNNFKTLHHYSNEVNILGKLVNDNGDTVYDKKNYYMGASVFIYNSEKSGLIVGLSGKAKYNYDDINSVLCVFRVGSGFNGYGAVEPTGNDAELIKTYYEISLLYCRNLNEIVDGLYAGGGLGIINGKNENDSEYFNLCLPLTIGVEIKIIKCLKIDFGINSQIRIKNVIWGGDIGFLIGF